MNFRCGIDEFKLTVRMAISSALTSTVSAFVKTISSYIIVNPIQVKPAMITNGYDQNLTLNPGISSIDLDGYVLTNEIH